MDKNAQHTDTIVMVRPAHFGFNPETAENNVFQNSDTHLSKKEIEDLAREEFDQMVDTLRDEGVKVIVIKDSKEPLKTDAIFPNNWFSTHRNGKTYLFPMFSANRRLERREDVFENFEQTHEVDIDPRFLEFEEEGKYLEGTGSMILDRQNKIIYACYSERTHAEVLKAFGNEIGYDVVGFHATDGDGIPYYHTNVIMTLGEHIAIICTASIEDESEKKIILDSLKSTNKKVVDISREQVLQFAGNMLELKGTDQTPLMVMSKAAFESLQKDQLYIIKNHNKIVYSPLCTIEKFGGGSARCMMAEIFLPNLD